MPVSTPRVFNVGSFNPVETAMKRMLVAARDGFLLVVALIYGSVLALIYLISLLFSRRRK